jgi:hypothetical protein
MTTDDEAAGDSGERREPSELESDPAGEGAAAVAEHAPKRAGKSSKKARERERQAAEAVRASTVSRARALTFAIAALAAGAAGGWFGHVAQAKAKLRADSAPAASGSAAAGGPCKSWEKRICTESGAESAACQQAKSATGLLTSATCEMALEAVPATLAKVKAERVPCDTLVGKLCKDLPPESPACTMVKDRTPSFPPERCRELLTNYDSVLGEVKMIHDQGGPPGGRPPGGPGAQPMPMPHGVPMPAGMPPGAGQAAPP